MSDIKDDLLFPDEIASLLSSTNGTLTLTQAPLASESDSPLEPFSAHDLAEARPYEFVAFDVPATATTDPDETQDAQLALQIELGRAELSPDEQSTLRAGSIVSLDKRAEDPVDIVIDGRLIARGEVLVLNDRLCVRVAEILGPRRVRDK